MKIKNTIIDKLEKRVKLFKDNARKMRAVLRVPRLTKQYQDMVREERIPEFDCIEKVYQRHFEGLAEDIVEFPENYKRLSIAERSLLDRSVKDHPP